MASDSNQNSNQRRCIYAILAAILVTGSSFGSEAQTNPLPYSLKTNLLVFTDKAGAQHPVRTTADWARRRAEILAAIQLVMGPLPNSSRKVPLDVRVLQEQQGAGFMRKKLSFAVEQDDRVPAWLLIPNKLKGRAPAMLCLHQTTAIGKDEPAGLGGNPNLHCAQELAERGYITLAPDYPNFGEYKVDPYARGYASASMKGIWNHMRAVDLLESLPEVDARRIGVIGHSLGGHNALFVAVFDQRLKAVVTSCGFNSFFEYKGGDLTGWSHAGYMPPIATVYGKDPRRMPFDFTEVLAALAPRPVFVNAPLHDDNFAVQGVRDCVDAAAPVFRLFRVEDRLTVRHPDCGHEFPVAVRQAAYDWLDHVLRGP
jgi:dienelactone hydrolase